MILAVDGMGGDNSPQEIVKGCIKAIEKFDVKIIITGPEDVIKGELSKYTYDIKKVEVLDAKDVISLNEPPVMAIRTKKESSLYKAINLVKKGEADGIISAGSTGALLAGSLLIIGRIRGIDRPALAPIMPGKNNKFMIIDCGANAECKPKNLLQFAYMGKAYYQNVLKKENPTIGLINIGAEEEKGNELTKEAYQLLKNSDLNFVGNVEPRDIPSGNTDILVSDGFVGNTVLKMYEGVASNIFSILKQEMMSSFKSKIGALLLKDVFKGFKKKFDYKEEGGAPFIGVKGICIKAHGSSDARAIYNGIRQAVLCYDNDIVGKIEEGIKNIQE